MTTDKADKLTEALDDAAAPPTSSDKFRDKLLEASRTDGERPIQYPDEILAPYVDERVRGGTWTKAGAKTLAVIIAGPHGFDLCAADVIDQLKELDCQYADMAKKQEPFSLSQSNKDFDDQRRKLIDKAHAGTLPGPDEIGHRSRDDIQNDYRARWAAFDHVLNKISRQAAELAIPVWQKAADAVFDSMTGVEKGERSFAENFNVPWQPSNVYRVHATLLLHCHMRITALNRFLGNAQGYSHMAPHVAVAPIVTLD